MSSFSTYIPEEDIELITRACGAEIRIFLSFLAFPNEENVYRDYWEGLDLKTLQGEYKTLVENFRARPDSFSDEALIKKGSGCLAHQEAVRIELRKGSKKKKGIAQVAFRGIPDGLRNLTLERFQDVYKIDFGRLIVKKSGQKSIEVNSAGVSKALPIRYFKNLRADSFLKAKECSSWIVFADGDGTLYSPPHFEILPGINQSAAFESFLSYLKAGGTFVLVTGNSLDRVLTRLKEIPHESYVKRFYVAANGGADLCYLDDRFEWRFVEDYGTNLLRETERNIGDSFLDMVYLGDDGDPFGNDQDAFTEIGFERSIFVGDKKWVVENEALKMNFVGENEKGVMKFLNALVSQMNDDEFKQFNQTEKLGLILNKIKE